MNEPSKRLPLPPYRQFEVRNIAKPKETVSAHVLQYTGRGQVLLFLDYRYVTRYDEQRNPVDTIVLELHRIINGYDDVREVNVPQVATSALLVH
jgi:hypothetical protein